VSNPRPVGIEAMTFWPRCHLTERHRMSLSRGFDPPAARTARPAEPDAARAERERTYLPTMWVEYPRPLRYFGSSV
jgi:hypothetical protein